MRVGVPGLADGESMDRDSLLPPALSESLHIPPLWLPTDHDLNGGGPRTAFEKKVKDKIYFFVIEDYDYIQNRKILHKLHEHAI